MTKRGNEQLVTPWNQAEGFLWETRKGLIEKSIANKEVVIIDRLLKSTEDMMPVYDELLTRFPLPIQWQNILDAIIGAAAYHNTEVMGEVREGIKEIGELSKEVADLAAKLAGKLDKLKKRESECGAYSSSDMHPVDLLAMASGSASVDVKAKFEMYTLPELNRLSMRNDWPEVADIIRAIGDCVTGADIETDHFTSAAIESQKKGSEFFSAIFEKLRLMSKPPFCLPCEPAKGGAVLSDKSLATIANVVLGLPDDEVVDDRKVTSIRQEYRRREHAR